MTDIPKPSTFLQLAADGERDAAERIADALTGLLASIVEHDDSQERIEKLADLHGDADDALGRVLELADTLDAHPHATLKPTAFSDLAKRIRAAVDGEVKE